MTPDELVEKVARAMYDDRRARVPLRTLEWAALDGEFQEFYRAQARAAILCIYEAMREPSEAMELAGDSSNRYRAAALYRAMLDRHPIAEVARDE